MARKVPCRESGAYEACGQRPSPSICPPSGLWTAMATRWKCPHPRLSGLTGKQAPHHRLPGCVRREGSARLLQAWALGASGPHLRASRLSPRLPSLGGCCRWLQVSIRRPSQERWGSGEKQVLRGHSGCSWASWVAGAAPAQGGWGTTGFQECRLAYPYDRKLIPSPPPLRMADFLTLPLGTSPWSQVWASWPVTAL